MILEILKKPYQENNEIGVHWCQTLRTEKAKAHTASQKCFHISLIQFTERD